MKNIHILPTDKPSRLYKTGSFLLLDSRTMPNNTLETKNQYIYITNDSEIKVGDWFYLYDADIIAKYVNVKPVKEGKKIILTTDGDLIKNGVQPIDDDFLEWFVKNPSCEEVEIELFPKFSNKLYGIIIPKEEPKQETLEEAAEREYAAEGEDSIYCDLGLIQQDAFIVGAKWQSERMYSEQEAYAIWKAGKEYWRTSGASITFEELLEQFKKK